MTSDRLDHLEPTDLAGAHELCKPCPRCMGRPSLHDSGPGWGYYMKCTGRRRCWAHHMGQSGAIANVVRAWNKGEKT